MTTYNISKNLSEKETKINPVSLKDNKELKANENSIIKEKCLLNSYNKNVSYELIEVDEIRISYVNDLGESNCSNIKKSNKSNSNKDNNINIPKNNLHNKCEKINSDIALNNQDSSQYEKKKLNENLSKKECHQLSQNINSGKANKNKDDKCFNEIILNESKSYDFHDYYSNNQNFTFGSNDLIQENKKKKIDANNKVIINSQKKENNDSQKIENDKMDEDEIVLNDKKEINTDLLELVQKNIQVQKIKNIYNDSVTDNSHININSTQFNNNKINIDEDKEEKEYEDVEIEKYDDELNDNTYSNEIKSRPKSKGWLLYYNNTECRTREILNELKSRFKKYKIEHIIIAYDGNKGIYGHIKFERYYNLPLKKYPFNIFVNNIEYKAEYTSYRNWRNILYLCTPRNYSAFFISNSYNNRQSFAHFYKKNIKGKKNYNFGTEHCLDNMNKKLGLYQYKKQIHDKKIFYRRNIWIYGKDLQGNINVVKETLKNIYQKDLGNEWKNYNGESNIIVELDIPYNNNNIAKNLKKWTEYRKYINNYKKMIIICEKSIEEYFAEDKDTKELMKKRCELIHMESEADANWVSYVLHMDEYKFIY